MRSAQSTRAFRRCTVEAYVDFPGQPPSFDWEVSNISVGGCRVRGGKAPLPLDEKVRLSLSFPRASLELDLAAVVVWAGERDYGLRFVEFPEGKKLAFAAALYARTRAA